MVKILPAMWETWVQPLGGEDPLEEGVATHKTWHIAALIKVISLLQKA